MHKKYLPPKTTEICTQCTGIICQSLVQETLLINYAGAWEEESIVLPIFE